MSGNYNVYNLQGAETTQYGLEIIFNVYRHNIWIYFVQMEAMHYLWQKKKTASDLQKLKQQ